MSGSSVPVIVPGAVYRPISVNYTDRVRSHTRAIVFHSTGAKSSTSQFHWFNDPAAMASSHIDIARDGTYEQYVDARKIAWGNKDGNRSTFIVEVENDGASPWTPQQCGTALFLMQWASDQFGIDLVVMPDSAFSSSGVGWHRLGIPYRASTDYGPVTPREGWLIAGNEWWGGASSQGKICPGDLAIEQIKQLVPLAKSGLQSGVRYQAGAFMISPMRGRFTSGYRTAARPSHEGIDIAPPVAGTVGFAVRAAFAGTVVKVVSNRRPGQKDNVGTIAPWRTGNGVIIKNPDGEYQLYNHVLPSVKLHQQVAAGQVIGHGDLSGNQSGTHLHFETWSAGSTLTSPKTFNPMILFNKYGITPGEAPNVSQSISKNDQIRLKMAVQPGKSTAYYTGLVDEVAGPMWQESVKNFQRDNRLVVDGDFGNISRNLFDAKYQSFFFHVQSQLIKLKVGQSDRSYYTGLHDGVTGELTYNSVLNFQRDNQLLADGLWGSVTQSRYDKALAKQEEANTPPPPPVEPPPVVEEPGVEPVEPQEPVDPDPEPGVEPVEPVEPIDPSKKLSRVQRAEVREIVREEILGSKVRLELTFNQED